MPIRSQLRVQQLTGSIAALAYSGSKTSAANASVIVDNHLGGVLGQFAGAIGRISGRDGTGVTSFTNNAKGTFYTAIKPDSAGGQDIGSAALEWGDLYIGDKSLYIGAGQEHEIGDIDGGSLQIRSTQPIKIGDNAVDQQIDIGTDGARAITIGDKAAGNTTTVEIEARGGAGQDITLENAAGSVNLKGGETIADAIFLDSAGGVRVDLGGNSGAYAFQIRDSSNAGVFRVEDNGTTVVKGDFFVEGTTTSVSSSNLLVRDPIAAFGIGSGSLDDDTYPGRAGDRGFVFPMTGAWAGSPVMYWDHTNISSGVPTGYFKTAYANSTGSSDSLTALGFLPLMTKEVYLKSADDFIGIDGSSNLQVVANAGLTLDAEATIKIDSKAGDIELVDNGTAKLKFDLDGTANAVVITNQVNGDDIIFKVDAGGTEIMRLDDSAGSLLIADAKYLQFRDSALNIQSPHDTVLEINSDSHIGLSASARVGIKSPEIDLTSQSTEISLKGGDADALTFDVGTNTMFTFDSSANAIHAADTIGLGVGTGRDLLLKHDGTNSELKNTAGVLRIDNANSSLILTASADNQIVYLGDGFSKSMNPSIAANGGGGAIKLAASAAEWTNFISTFSATTSIVKALTDAAGAGTRSRDVVNVTSTATNVTSTLTGFFSLANAASLDVYLNGQLMVSQSSMSAGSGGDYYIDGDSRIKFTFNVEDDDAVTFVKF